MSKRKKDDTRKRLVRMSKPVPGVLAIEEVDGGPEPNYRALVHEMIRQSLRFVHPGRCYDLQVLHENWCPLAVNGGRCGCNPSCQLVEFVEPEDK
jgi:hypothetical protein